MTPKMLRPVREDLSSRPILDACCGSRMFWFDARNPNVLFVDNRRLDTQAIWKSGNGKAVRYCTVDPDVLADFRHLPFPDESFWHIVFDPPHLYSVGDNAWMAKKYGKLPKDWKPLIHDGFHECWRVLKANGTLIFKWNEDQIAVRENHRLHRRPTALWTQKRPSVENALDGVCETTHESQLSNSCLI